MADAAAVGKEILPGGRDFHYVPRLTPGSGGEERSDEVPEPGVRHGSPGHPGSMGRQVF